MLQQQGTEFLFKLLSLDILLLINDVIIGKEFQFLVPVTHTEESYTKFLVSAP